MMKKTERKKAGPEVAVKKTEDGLAVTEITITNPGPAELIKGDIISDLEVAKKMIKINQSAIDRKLEYNLSFETVKRLMSYKTCFYTGKSFGDENTPQARSFDRVDSSKGYVEGNVVACTVDINQKKSNMSLEEITCLYTKLVKKSEK